jgi:ammonium transporter, Amt family
LLAVCITNPEAKLSAQLIGIVCIFGFVFITSSLTWFVIKSIMGIRVSEEDEYHGVDFSECGMEAYPEFTDSSKG